MVHRHIVNCTDVELRLLSWTTLKNSSEGKPSQQEELWEVYTAVHLCGGKTASCVITYRFRGCIRCFSWMVRGLGGAWPESDRKDLRKEVVSE